MKPTEAEMALWAMMHEKAEQEEKLEKLANNYCDKEELSPHSPEGCHAYWAFIAGYKAAQKSTD